MEEDNSHLSDPSVRIHSFTGKVGEERVYFQVTSFARSLYLWIGGRNGVMNDLALAASTPYDASKSFPTSTKLFGHSGHNDTEALTTKLARKLGKPVLLSLNTQLSSSSPFWGDLERALFEEIKIKPECF